MHRRLKIKLLIIQLFSIIPFLLFIFYLFDLWYDTRRSQILESNLAKAKLVKVLVQQTFQNGTRIAENLAENDSLWKTLEKDKESANDMLKNLTGKAPEINNAIIFNPKGEPILATLKLTEEQEKITIWDRPYFQEVLKTKKPAVSSLLLGKYTGEKVLAVAVPVVKKEEVEKVVTVSLTLEYLKNLLDQAIGENGKHIIVLGKERQIVFATNQLFSTEEEKPLLANYPFVKKAQDEKIALIENQNLPFLKTSIIGAAVFMENFNWIVLSVESMENVFAPLFKLQSVIWLIIFAALLFSVSLITYFLRKVRVAY